jgi:hypothetical protein
VALLWAIKQDRLMSDLHAHYCRQCRVPWEHDGAEMDTNERLKAAHRCPRCGQSNYVKFYGNETHDEMCEMEALLELSEDERVPESQRYQAERDFARMAQRLHRPSAPYPPQEEDPLVSLLDFWRGLRR